MNKREIDEMMRHLPSQQREETLIERCIIGTMFIVFLVLLMMLPELYR